MTLLWLEMPIEEPVIASWMTREGKAYVHLSFLPHKNNTEYTDRTTGRIEKH